MFAALLLTLQLLAFASVAGIAIAPRTRHKLAWLLVILGVASLGAAAWDAQNARSLAITHQFTAYVGVNIQRKVFEIEQIQGAPGYGWGVLCAAFCFGWAIVGMRWRDRRPAAALGLPLALAWSGCALQLLLEKVAAPPGLLRPFDVALDRVLLPATLAGAWLLARPGRRVLHLGAYLVLFVAVTRLPLALFGTLATRGEWGTHLDVHGTEYFVPLGVGGVEVQPGDSDQLFWLIWAPHLVVFPMLYVMSTGGLAFVKLMWEAQKLADAERAAATR